MKYTKNVVDTDLRNRVFEELDIEGGSFVKVNDRQYGIIFTDKNGVERYVRVGAIVAEERDDMTARELMESEIRKYQETQEKKAQKAQEKAKKIASDEKKRKEKAKKQEDADDANQYLDREIAV